MILLLLAGYACANLCLDALESDARSIVQLSIQDFDNFNQKLVSAQRFVYTGKDVNDMGHWASCVALPDTSYLILDLKIIAAPTHVGLCVPSVCTPEALHEIIKSRNLLAATSYFSQVLYDANNLLAATDINIFPPKTYDLGIGGTVTLFLMFSLLCLIVIATYADYISRTKLLQQENTDFKDKTEPKEESGGETRKETRAETIAPVRSSYFSVLMCFSFIKNWNNLFYQPVTDSTRIFDGVKSMSVMWVIISHIFITRCLGVVYNLEDVPYVYQSPLRAFDYSGAIVVDTFFWVGGFIFGFLILDEALKRKGRMTWLPKIIGRVLRMLPVYVFVMGFILFIEPSMGEGPLWHHIDTAWLDCDKYWWTNFLFINNIVPGFQGNDCMGQSWYLAVDMQCFLLSILLINLYSKYPKSYTWITIGTVAIVTAVLRTSISLNIGLNASLFNSNSSPDNERQIYTKTYARCDPYFIGLLCGFIYSQYKSQKYPDKYAELVVGFITSSKKIAYSLFLLGVVFIGIIFWYPYPCFTDINNDFLYYGPWGNAFYFTLFPILTGLGFSFMFLPVLFGMIPLVYEILAWKGWLPVAKASFSIYISHLCVMRGFLASEHYGFTMSHLNMFTDFVFNATIEVPLGVLIYLAVEAPFNRLLKLAIKPKPRPTTEESLLGKEMSSIN